MGQAPEMAAYSICSVDHATAIVVDIIVAFAILYFFITWVLLLSKLRSYRKQPYTFVQVGRVYNTLQVVILQPYSCALTDVMPTTIASLDSTRDVYASK